MFHNIFMNILHTIWSFLAENGPKILKYAYFSCNVSRKTDTSILEGQNQYQSNVMGSKILVTKLK